MSERLQERLLDYLLGGLSAAEEREIEQAIATDPVWQNELEGVRRRFAFLLSARAECEPPSGLTARTCALVFAHERPAAGPARRAMSPASPDAAWGSRINRSDIVAAVCVLLVAFGVLFPALGNSRFNAQIFACQDNLRDLGAALTQYSEDQGGYFPRVPQRGPLAAAGVYAPTLVQFGALQDPKRVVCPASPLAGQPRAKLVSLEQLTAMPPEKAHAALPALGGSYGYTLGYVQNGEYHDTQNLRRSSYAILADAPGDTSPNRQSLNHGGKGENILFEDGRVVFMPAGERSRLPDDVFSNDAGLVAAGVQRDDSVVVSGGVGPSALK